jgi:hypothetical protein
MEGVDVTAAAAAVSMASAVRATADKKEGVDVSPSP